MCVCVCVCVCVLFVSMQICCLLLCVFLSVLILLQICFVFFFNRGGDISTIFSADYNLCTSGNGDQYVHSTAEHLQSNVVILTVMGHITMLQLLVTMVKTFSYSCFNLITGAMWTASPQILHT